MSLLNDLTLNFRVIKTGMPPIGPTLYKDYLSPLYKYAPKNVKLIETETPVKPGEPLLALCLTGGTEAPVLKLALENPRSPAVILVHDRSSSFASGCELSARLQHETKIGNRAPAIFCSINDESRVKSVIKAAAVASKFNEVKPKLGIIGKPSDWLIASDFFAEKLPEKFGIQNRKIQMEQFVSLIKDNNSVYTSLKTLISQNNLEGVTIRCFDLVKQLSLTSCLEVSRLNDEGYTAGCEGDIPSAVTMMIMKAISGSPVFMANPTGYSSDCVTFAHCTIPKKLCTSTKITTHYESGLGTAICGKVKAGKWTVARFSPDGDVMADNVDLESVSTPSPNHCRTQIVVKPSKKFIKKIRKGKVLGNHFMFVPGSFKEELKIFSKYFQMWQHK